MIITRCDFCKKDIDNGIVDLSIPMHIDYSEEEARNARLATKKIKQVCTNCKDILTEKHDHAMTEANKLFRKLYTESIDI